MSALNPLYMALAAMFAQQSFAMMAKITTPILAAVAFPALGVDASHVGVFTGFYSFCQIFVVLVSGNMIRRYGGLRVTQIGLVAILVGMAAAGSGWIWAFALTAVFVSFGVSVTTPAAAQIISRYAPPQHAPLIFSAKQTAVPVGQIASGLVVPALVALYGWQGAFLGVGLMCFAFAFVLQPVRRELDKDRDPSYRLSPRDIRDDVRHCLADPGIRRLVLTQGAYVAVWAVYSTYFVVFFIERMHYSLAEAGGMFATATLIGLPARMIWGYVAGRWLSSIAVLALLGFFTSVFILLTGLGTAAWPAWALLTVAVGVNIGATGWQGIALAETARLAPAGRIGAITACVNGLSCIGQVILPPIFAVVLLFTDSYTLGFALVAATPLLTGIMLLAANRRDARQLAE